MSTLLEKKASELDELVAIVHEIQEKAANEDRDLTDVETDRIKALGEAATKLRGECEFLNEQVVSERAWSRLRADIDANRPDSVEDMRRATRSAAAQPGGSLDVHTRGWGDQFVESDAFKNYHGAGSSQRVALDLNLERRAAIDTTFLPQNPFLYTPAAFTFASPMLDRVGKVTTGVNSVEWVQWTPNPMAAVAETPEGQAKPEADMLATPVTGVLKTYATWKAITRQALDDIPQIRSTVENRLRQSITVTLEGLISTSLGAATLTNVASTESLLAAIRHGIAVVQAAGYVNPNMVLINPADAATIDIAMMGGTLNGAVVNNSYFGIPWVASNSVPVNTAYVGDFSVGVQLFTRGQTEVFLTDSHADYFIRNLIALLAETRALATVPDPGALAECTGPVAGP